MMSIRAELAASREASFGVGGLGLPLKCGSSPDVTGKRRRILCRKSKTPTGNYQPVSVLILVTGITQGLARLVGTGR